MKKSSLISTLRNLLWGVVAVATAGVVVERNVNKETPDDSTLVGNKGLWNDFANLAFGISKAKNSVENDRKA